MHYNLQNIKGKLLLFLELQLLLSLCLLPIFIAWGLPISTMSIVGNYIFAPFLTVFIFFSTLLCTSGYLGIPNSIIAMTLNYIADWWHLLLSFGSKQWLIGFPTIFLPLSIIMIAIAMISYQYKKHQYFRVILLCALHITLVIAKQTFHAYTSNYAPIQIEKNLYTFKKNNVVYLIDNGCLARKKSYQSWIDYTLTPFLIKNIGTMKVNHTIFCKQNHSNNPAIQYLTSQLLVDTISSINRFNKK